MDLIKASLSVVHPATSDTDTIMKNYEKANAQAITQQNPTFKKNISFGANPQDKFFDLAKIKQYKLANNMELVLNPNKSDIATSKITMSTQAPANIKPCIPAILTVILNEGTKTKNFETFYKEVHKSGITMRFDADFHSITAHSESLADDLPLALDLVKEVFSDPRLIENSFEYAKKLVKEAVLNTDSSAKESAMRKLFPNRPEFATRDEILQSIKTVTLDEVIGFFEYVKNNAKAKGIFTAPIETKPIIEQTIIEKLSSGLQNFRPFDINVFNSYAPTTENIVLTKAEPRNQADIVQIYKFKTNYNPKDQVVFKVLNTILGDGPSSRLFNDLRETQKLAYRVNSSIDFTGNTGLITLGINTTTDDKIANIQQFDNVQKSLDGFKEHIEKLKNTTVSTEELEAAKLRMKTKLLNSIETSDSQNKILNSSKDSLLGLNSLNENLRLLDTVTAQDIKNAANYIFENPPVISILASQDTIDFYNKKTVQTTT